jgi:hypothetical protein
LLPSPPSAPQFAALPSLSLVLLFDALRLIVPVPYVPLPISTGLPLPPSL